jgi:hypothetical protein
MRGYDNFNRDSFNVAERRLKSKGIYDVVNPANYDLEAGVTKENFKEKLRECLARDCQDICGCSIIYMLRGWEESLGARAEHALGTALGLSIMYE